MEFHELVVAIARALGNQGIPYAITGGVAVSAWGRPRSTYDIDFTIAVSAASLPKIVAALRSVVPAETIDEAAIERAVAERDEFNVVDLDTGIKADFWVAKDDAFSKSEFARRRSKPLLGETVSFLSPEDLILRKLLWHKQGESAQQLLDVESILRVQQSLDWDYLRRWATEQTTWDVLDALRQRLEETS